MNVLITGAAGFIGSQIAYRLWKEGHEVLLLDNFSYGREDNLVFPDVDFRSRILRIDIRDRKAINEVCSQHAIECIYHIAGIAPLPDCQSAPAEAVEVNVTGTVTILEAARTYGIPKIVFASTTALYENDVMFPSHEARFELPTLIYPNTKYAAERFCQSYADTYGMSISALRFANVYGPHIDCLRKQPPFVAYMIRELWYDRIPTFYSNGTQSRDYIYIDDLIDLALKVAENKAPGFEAVNVSAHQSYSVNELYGIVCEVMGKNIVPVFENPEKYWAKYPALYEGAYPITQKILDHEVNKKTLCDNTYAREKYGWEPQVDIRSGLARVVAYVDTLLSTQ